MNNYIVQIISTFDSNLKRELEINDCYLNIYDRYYQFLNEKKEIIACFPIDRTIVLRVKK